MAQYELTWITDQLATGYAPMSYAELDFIREQGISAIVNLCGEFCDLHQIEEKSGFEVYYLPVDDECAPDLAEMEKALEWLDEAVYLKKKVLVITSYSIHYTKLYECCSAAGARARATPSPASPAPRTSTGSAPTWKSSTETSA